MALDFWQGLFPFVRPSFSTQQTDSNDDHTANNPNDTDNVERASTEPVYTSLEHHIVAQ